jgi:hypothetical protein
LSKSAQEEDEEVEFGKDSRNWELGDRLRRHGSVHSDTWRGTAAQLASCGMIAVFPVTGWWRERPHLGRHEQIARYSLIVSISTESQDIDLYTPIATQIAVPIRTTIET